MFKQLAYYLFNHNIIVDISRQLISNVIMNRLQLLFFMNVIIECGSPRSW